MSYKPVLILILLNVVLILFQHGPISIHGPLMCTGNAICYEKLATKTTKKNKLRECAVFIFTETIIICDEVKNDQKDELPLFNYWVSFQVCTYYLLILIKENYFMPVQRIFSAGR